MFSLKSKSLINYLGEIPDDYRFGFRHYNVDILEPTQEELDLVEEDLNNIKDYVGNDKFKIYFSDAYNYKLIKDKTNIVNEMENYIYVRVRNQEEYDEILDIEKDANINIIINKEHLSNINISNDRFNKIIQINNVDSLSLEELEYYKEKYNIENVIVGQIVLLSNYFIDFFKQQAEIYGTKTIDGEIDFLETEKNFCICNDLYSLSTYKSIFNRLKELTSNILDTDNEATKFYKVYMNIISEIAYADGGFGKIENQNLYGGLFNRKCVCEGYSKIMQQALSLVGIESIIIGAASIEEDVGHVWNQVKIDGKWYNADAAYGNYQLNNNIELYGLLRSDEYIEILGLEMSDSPLVKKCDEDYDLSKINIKNENHL